ncbi:MAG: peptide chain release factor N(5)-glutamine methyltransferase [Bacilli bacterium]|jgi:release factor glutamine methyltransferase
MKYFELLDQLKKEAEKKSLEKEAIKILFIETNFKSKEAYYLNSNNEMPKVNLNKTLKLSKLYLERQIPIQYILGYTYFLGDKILTKKGVLIPRFETEEVVLKALEVIKTNFKEDLRIIDIGTGSGAIAIALKNRLNSSLVEAVDINRNALNLTKKNALLNKVDIKVYRSNLLKDVKGKLDVIISNPPYISKDEYVETIVLKNEPASALFAKKNGLYYYEKILEEARFKVNKKFAIIFEISYNKKGFMEELAKKYFPTSQVEFFKDINQNDRIMVIKETDFND